MEVPVFPVFGLCPLLRLTQNGSWSLMLLLHFPIASATQNYSVVSNGLPVASATQNYSVVSNAFPVASFEVGHLFLFVRHENTWV